MYYSYLHYGQIFNLICIVLLNKVKASEINFFLTSLPLKLCCNACSTEGMLKLLTPWLSPHSHKQAVACYTGICSIISASYNTQRHILSLKSSWCKRDSSPSCITTLQEEISNAMKGHTFSGLPWGLAKIWSWTSGFPQQCYAQAVLSWTLPSSLTVMEGTPVSLQAVGRQQGAALP